VSTQEPNRSHTAEHAAPAARVAACAFLALSLACAPALAAQEQQEQQEPTAAQQPARDDVGPPPIRHLPDAVRRQLDEARDVKARTKAALELLEQSLARSAAHASADRFEDATGELGVYEALVKETIAGVQASGRVTNKQRDLYKKIELALRSHVTRLETIRRSLPARNGVHVQATIEFIRDQRDLALNSFYDDTVIPDERPKEKAPAGHSAKGSALTPAESEKKPDQR
jgi:hypothetical protein